MIYLNYNDFIEYKKKRIKDVRDYDKSLRKHLIKTEKKLNTPLSFNLLKQGQGKFIEHWEDGSKVVIAVRNKTAEPGLMKYVRTLFYGLISKISDTEQIRNFTGFGKSH